MLERRGRRRVGQQVLQAELQHPAQREQRGQAWVERRPRPRLALLELLIGVRRDAGEVGGPLLARAPSLTGALEPDPDVTAELLPGRFCSSLPRHVVDCAGPTCLAWTYAYGN